MRILTVKGEILGLEPFPAILLFFLSVKIAGCDSACHQDPFQVNDIRMLILS